MIYIYIYREREFCTHSLSLSLYIYIYIFFFFIKQCVKACAIPYPHQSPTRGDNTVSVAQGGTATPGATKQLLPPDRVLRELYIYIYIYIYIYVCVWQYCLELPKLCYHPWLAADEDMVLHVLSHVVWWKKKRIYIYIYIYRGRERVGAKIPFNFKQS